MPLLTRSGRSVAIPPAAAHRAATRWVLDEDTGCWISTYSVGSHGYAQVGWGGKVRSTTTAHRAAWTHAYGPIPEGMTVDHTCRSHRCVRPDHLRLLTLRQNASDGAHHGWRLRRQPGYTPATPAKEH